jgi:hypothetical protein
MICPACKSNNIDTAKFCGGCGTPLKSASAPAASTLVNCAQGHVYSSVYNACPYCPPVDRKAPADFATRIEPSAETTIEPAPTVVQPVGPKSAPATVIEPPMENNRTGQMRRDYATVIDPGMDGSEMRTGQLPEAQITQVTPVTPPRPSAPATVIEPPVAPQPPAPVAPPVTPPPSRPAPPITVVAPPPVTPVAPPVTPPVAPPVVPPLPFPAQAPVGAKGPERRTVVVPEEGAVSPGRLVGWLVSFSKNPDGVDYRLRAGRNVIGANPNCDIVVDDEAVSGTHASIVWRNGRCYIKDELSSNGTYLNNSEITEPAQLQSGDQVRIGNALLTFIALNP